MEMKSHKDALLVVLNSPVAVLLVAWFVMRT
jgi:hypothetical protein